MWKNEKVFGVMKNEDLLSVIDECTDNYMFIFDITHDYYTISRQAVDTFNLETNVFGNASSVFETVVYAPDMPILQNDLERLKSGESNDHNLEYRWIDKSGKPVWISCRGKSIYDKQQECLFLVGSITELGKQNKYDNITSLYNESVLEQEYKKVQQSGNNAQGVMLLIGVDNFKGINEKYGTSTGDGVLADIASCITDCVKDMKHTYRLRGDEFAILHYCGKETAIDEAKELYKQIRNKVDYYIEQKEYQIFYTISSGAYCFDTQKDNLETVMHNLRFALHSAKMKGKNTFVAYSEELYQNHMRKMDIQENLRRSITNNFEGFEVYYQPVVDPNNNRLHGSEALIRWNSKKYGFMSPVEFVPLLEESSLIIPLGRWIIDQAVMQCKKWIEIVPDYVMNINLSFVQIVKSDILKDVLECVDYHGLEHHHLVFEATESGELENNNAVKNVLNSFNNQSFSLAIDDFGTGYSNLRYIRDMMFSIIKIDRLFVKNIDESNDNYTLVKYVIEMAHSLGVKVCVEGVETQAELDKIMTLSPDCIQGYYYGKPVDAETFEKEFLKDKLG